MNSFKLIGSWWLPSDKNNSVEGILDFDPLNGGTLNLIGSFESINEINKLINYDIILGVADGKILTLVNCHLKNRNLTIPGTVKSSYSINYIFEGHYFKSKEELTFSDIYVNYLHLNEWLNISGFVLKTNYSEDNKLISQNLDFSWPEQEEYNLEKFNLITFYDYNFNSEKFNHFTQKQISYFKFNFNHPISFVDFLTNINSHFQNLLSFFLSYSVYPLYIKALSFTSQKKVNIYFKINKNENKKFDRDKILISYPEIKENFNDILKNWFLKKELLSPVFDLYFSILNTPELYIETKFLNYVYAIESYHRRKFDGFYIDKEKFKSLYNELVTSLPKNLNVNFRNSIKNRLEYLNEYSLQKRLKEIIKLIENHILFLKDTKIFIQDVVNTRNYYTHYDKNLEKKRKQNIELFYLNLKLKYIIEILFLIEMGIEKKIVHIFENSSSYKYLFKNEERNMSKA